MDNRKQRSANQVLQPSVKIGELAEALPVILETVADDNYALIDSGNGEKLERYGPYRIIRPEPQALWQRTLPESEWRKADAIFTSGKDKDEEGAGRWQFPATPLGETWPLEWDGISYHGRFTSFRHVGVFPEQAAHWRYMERAIGGARREIKVLNLFGYTGLASLAAARCGAHVTHVDASKKAIGWARENQSLAGLQDKPIRWICDDAVKFCERELRRENRYDAILLDPPKYGRGPKGEIWQLFEHLPHMLEMTAKLTSNRPLFVILTAYSIRASFYAMHELMRDAFAQKGGLLESGELVIAGESGNRRLSTSLFSRWSAA